MQIHEYNQYKLGLSGSQQMYVRLRMVPVGAFAGSYELENIFATSDSSSVASLGKEAFQMNVLSVDLVPENLQH